MLLKIALVFVLPTLAFAQVNLQPYNLTAALMFADADIDGDGLVTHNEIHLDFMTYDADGDGRISRNEYVTVIDQTEPQLHDFAHALYDIYDVDGDHHLDEHDFANFHTLMDGNGDGDVDASEFIHYWEVLLESLEHLHGGGK